MTTAKTELTPLKLLTLCYPVIPSGGGESGKAPLVNWLKYQTSYPDENDLDRWENELKPPLWGIVTGEMAGIVIIDIDNPGLKNIFDAAGLGPHIQTPRGGFHYWFRHPGHHVKTVAGLLPGIDVRADGGFVNVIGKRKDGEYKTLIVPTPDTIYPWEKLPQVIINAIDNNGNHPTTPPAIPEKIPEGKRNATLTSLAGTMRRRGITETAIKAALLEVNQTQCDPPLPEDDIHKIAKSVGRYPATPPTDNTKEYITYLRESDGLALERDKSVTESVTKPVIEDWIKDTGGAWFSYEEIDKEFGIKAPHDKDNRRQIIKRLKDTGTIEAHPRNNKLFRYVNVSVRLVDFRAAGKRSPLAVKYPFGIEEYFNTYMQNIIVVAGAADAGKTAFLLNFIKLNQENFSIFYQTSEMGDAELASRLEKFEDISLDEWNFTAEERSHDFADVIRPDCINIIDYMELSGDFYKVADYLKQIHDKLAGGIAIVALQKKRGAEIGRGGEFALEKPRLYLSMDLHQIKVVKAKNWADPTFNPKDLILKFKIVAGCKFIVDEDWHKDE